MGWRWSQQVGKLVQATLLSQVDGGRLEILASEGPPLVSIPLSGMPDGVFVGEASHTGTATKAVLEGRAGDILATAPANSVLDHTDIERGARVTVTLRIGV